MKYPTGYWLHVLQAEHNFFRDPDGRIALADESGYYPHQTDDGVLYLIANKPAFLKNDGNIWFQVENPSGDKSMIIESNKYGKLVAKFFGIKVLCEVIV
jgi:hypothetical protein